MKKVFVLFICLSLTGILRAQEGKTQFQKDADDKKEKIDRLFYILAGGLGGRFSGIGDDYSESKTKIGAQIGLGLNVIEFSKLVSLHTELIYSQQGSKSSSGGDYGYNSSGSVRLNYLNLPVVGHFHSPGGFYAEAGLQPGLLLSAKSKYSVSGTGGSGSSTTDVKEDYNKFDMGIPVGLGYELKNGFSVGLRVVPGISNIRKSESTVEAAPKVHNFVVGLRAAYAF